MSVTDPDEEWVSTTRHRSRWRFVLAGGLVLALTFLGGVLVQKEYGAESADAAGAPTGLPGGSFPGGAMPGGAMPGGAVPGGADADGSDATTSVIGTVVAVEGDVWTVEDLGGTEHQVTVPATASVTEEAEIAASDVALGTTVDVEGTTGDADELTASQITVRGTSEADQQPTGAP